MSKNIVIFSDGTGQEGGKGPDTNIYKLFKEIEHRTPNQVSFYDRGLGTGWKKFTGSVGGSGIQRNILEAAFRGMMTRALAQELNRIRRNGITGQALMKNLSELYYQHNMRDWIDRRGLQIEDQPVPVIICSEGLANESE